MNLRSLAKNAGVAFLAQGVAMCVSIITTLLVPKILGVEEYGYWQLFIFYQSYVGFCHLGLNDGVYLLNGGRTREQIDKRLCNSEMWVAIAFQAIIAAIAFVVILVSPLGQERVFVITCVVIYMLIKNTALYIGYLFQAMNETTLYSISCILERVSFLLPLLACIVLRVDRFEIYVCAYLVAGVIQLLYCAWHARDFLTAGFVGATEAVQASIASIRIGIKLMLANIASQLILGVARFVIDLVWGIETFGKLSLSLSMVNFFLAFVSQAAMVLFPALRQSGENDQKRFYVAARDTMSLVFPAVYILYYPMRWILSLWLPAYADSLVFFAYLLPICVFDSKMNITCTTLFKVRREEKLLFIINVATTVFSAFGTLLGAYVFESIYVVIAAVTLAIIGRSLASEYILTRKLAATSPLRLSLGELAATVLFVFLSSYSSSAISLVAYCGVYTAFLVINRDKLSALFGSLKNVIPSP